MTEATWRWWWSQDEEHFYGPCSSREEAISEARVNLDRGDSYTIMEAKHGPFLATIFADLDDRFDDLNENNADPDGDPLSASITAEQWRDLETILNNAAAKWADEHKLHKLVWGFEAERNREDLRIEIVDEDEASK